MGRLGLITGLARFTSYGALPKAPRGGRPFIDGTMWWNPKQGLPQVWLANSLQSPLVKEGLHLERRRLPPF